MSHSSYSDLKERIQDSSVKVKVGGLYYHWKDPKTHYKVIAIGLNESDESIVVIYQNIDNQIVWVRALEGDSGWLTPVNADRTQKQRFVAVKLETLDC